VFIGDPVPIWTAEEIVEADTKAAKLMEIIQWD